MSMRFRSPIGMGAEQVGLDTDQVAIATGVLEDGLDTGLLFDQERQRQGTETRAGTLAVGNTDDVHSAGFQPPCAIDDRLGLKAARRHQFHRGHERAAG